ncbi:hypothetical protein 7S12_26 [uncultured Caudovirales phage]|uniref:Uncharacterized protein n=1 Tax=uncultured Caudovirales phage TaxID=2100421 RepID=A0A2H4J766_9CAUD|nr:hypothetical protein [Pseudomonas faucium]ASN71012.1 hypothetical protein 7F10_26 [uncultured Caudovirales phage]ASN71114.1 hypothetical protein 3S10_27 [uncultured Caudovirales phage]ASN71283.1 hypothetical protein 7AX5_26 [uncultured Caudovirales phage]ASN71339.1 hypothetical protein 7S12_26 [uncultured Caudovirales phage]ASN71386.1 hypothetical protein 9F3_26 [uncultured Caudovirales phage]
MKIIHQWCDDDEFWLDANEQSLASARAAGWKTRTLVELDDAPLPDSVRCSLMSLLRDDSYAASFQSLGQYRTALLRAIREDLAR